MNNIKTVKTSRELLLPKLPNFLLYASGGTVSVADVDEATLDAIAQQWGEELKKHARRVRKTGSYL